MKHFTLFLTIISTAFYSFGQVSQSIIVEHFTNSRCSVCASRNPGFNQNLANQANTVRITFHPSSPYANCELNKLNTTENDARTNFYSIYGSTPRLVLNGDVIPTSAKYNEPALFDPYENITTPIEVSATISQSGNQVNVEVTVSAAATHSYSTEKLSVFLVHDVLDFNAPNGETEHYNVFLESMTAINGDNVAIPAMGTTDKVVTLSTPLKSSWNTDRIRAVVVIQDAGDKSAIQSYQTSTIDGTTSLANPSNKESQVSLYPNPTQGNVKITGLTKTATYKVFNAQGQTIMSGQTKGTIELNNRVTSGVFYIELSTSESNSVHRLMKR